jgi:thioredoxin-related protein
MNKVITTVMMLSSLLFGSEIAWVDTYTKAAQLAKAENKIIYMLMTTDQCRWCRKLESTTLQDERVIQRINATFVPIHMTRDVDDYPEHLKARGVPTSFFLTPEGRIVHKMPGYWDVTDYLSVFDDAERKIKRMKQQ